MRMKELDHNRTRHHYLTRPGAHNVRWRRQVGMGRWQQSPDSPLRWAKYRAQRRAPRLTGYQGLRVRLNVARGVGQRRQQTAAVQP